MTSTTEPYGVKLSRAAGWRKPPNTVSVARPGKYGNPHKARTKADRRVAVLMYEDDLYNGRLPYTVEDVRRELEGKNLGCWCDLDGWCHRNVLLHAANVKAAT